MLSGKGCVARECSLQRQLEIVPGRLSHWRQLEEFHYRSGRLGPIDKVFVIQRRPGVDERRQRLGLASDGPVGVIVYGMPVPCVALRNRATENRYVGLGDQTARLALINKELRCINRVVIHPQYRGIGLAHWLVRETLTQAGTPLVEALAVMGKVNPFFEKAGMMRYEAPLSAPAVRMLAALEQAQIEQEGLYDTKNFAAKISDLPDAAQRFVRKEMQLFAARIGSRPVDDETDGELEHLIRMVARHVLSRPVYYLWRRKG